MAGQHHRCNEHELGQILGDSEGQGGLACGSPWGGKELGMTGKLNNNNKMTSPEKESKYFPSCVLSCFLTVPDAGRGCQNNETKLTAAGFSAVF